VYLCQVLPIEALFPEIQAELGARNTLIIQASPGAGKSTWLPVQLLSEPWLENKKILLLEPRRLAVKSVAARLAWQLNEPVGEQVGYRIRFENKISARTRLEVITEGILTRMLLSDNAMEEVGLIFLDEFHERNLTTDTAFVLARECQKILRPDLRLVVMSATLPGEKIALQMDQCRVLKSEGRQFPIDIHYLESPALTPTIAQSLTRAILVSLKQDSGDILAFLPGKGEIQSTLENLQASDLAHSVSITPLFGDQEMSVQEKALIPDAQGRRKIVLATSIAETSLTIEGIRVVIDSGFSRVPRYDPRSGLSRLVTVRVSKESADQRAGRAGRLGPGKAYRLWTKGEHASLSDSVKPEILEADLSNLVLELCDWGMKDILNADWPDKPSAGALAQAIEWLETAGVIQEKKLTTLGKSLLKFPAHPRIGALLITAQAKGLESLGASLVALIEEKDPLPELGCDIEPRLEALMDWKTQSHYAHRKSDLARIDRISQQWRNLLQVKNAYTSNQLSQIGLLLASAYPERVAKQTEPASSRYRLANGRFARIPEQDTLIRSEWIVIARMDAGQQEGKIFLAAPLNIQDLQEKFTSKKQIEWNEGKQELICRETLNFGSLIVQSRPIQNPSQTEIRNALIEAVRKQGKKLLAWTEEAENFMNRVNSLKLWRPTETWPAMNPDSLLEKAEEWLPDSFNGKPNSCPPMQVVLPNLLSWEQQQALSKLAPLTLTIPTGSAIKLQYFPDGSPPVLAVRLQEVFGLAETPTVDEGRMPVIMHLLSPGYKPVQITRDLKSFWNSAYFEVRKDLRSRYPKHAWPEDPWKAEPVRKGRSEKK